MQVGHLVTLIFLQEESVQDYLFSTVQYYETGSCESCKALFLREYGHTIKELFEAQQRALEQIRRNRGG